MDTKIAQIELEQKIAEELKNLTISFLEDQARLYPELATRIELMIYDQISIWSSKNAILENKKAVIIAMKKEGS